ncbi:hypothetical protein GQ600_26072 [Phytophthora cactorum]|nr:hypothetical protein GQ600_26072 [Phytophthora cactorum]
MSVVVVLGSVLDLVSPIDERPLSLFQGSVSEWSDMRTCPAVLVYVAIIVYDTINCTQLRATWTNGGGRQGMMRHQQTLSCIRFAQEGYRENVARRRVEADTQAHRRASLNATSCAKDMKRLTMCLLMTRSRYLPDPAPEAMEAPVQGEAAQPVEVIDLTEPEEPEQNQDQKQEAPRTQEFGGDSVLRGGVGERGTASVPLSALGWPESAGEPSPPGTSDRASVETSPAPPAGLEPSVGAGTASSPAVSPERKSNEGSSPRESPPASLRERPPSSPTSMGVLGDEDGSDGRLAIEGSRGPSSSDESSSSEDER